MHAAQNSKTGYKVMATSERLLWLQHLTPLHFTGLLDRQAAQLQHMQ